MANHDLILGQSHNLGLRQNQQLALGHDHSLDLVQDHDLDLRQAHEHHLGLEHEHELDLGHPHDDEMGLGQSQNDEGEAVHNYGHGNDLGIDQKPEHGDHELALTVQNHELALSENNELVVSENQELDDNLQLTMDQDQEMSLEHAQGLTIEESQLIVHSPVIQARTLSIAPNYELAVGQEFPDVFSCRRALRDTAIALHFEMQTIKSDKTRFTAKCATKLPGVPTFTIRTIHESHTCGGISHLGHQQASVQWVANSVERQLKENPNYKPKEILEEIHRVHGITLSYKQAWRGKERIMAAMRGSFEEGYRLLPQYCDQVKRTNPGSISSVYGNPMDNCFQRLFISFQASIYGFLNACRPLLGLDRTFLKSKYLGTLFLATGFDGDGALFPLAFGVVDEENEENWMWFLSELHSLLEINTENMPRLTILSDRQKGIIDGVEANFPTAFHGFCMRHLKIEEISQDAAYWIRRIPPRLWATAYFEGTRFGHLTANIVESMNTWILEASGLPIIQMMECIRRQLMTWFNERRETSMQWTSILVPSAERRVAEALERARTYQVLRANEAEFEVISHEGTNIVDIRNRCCLCRGWQLYGLPCAHAVAALLSCRQNVHRFTESCFTVATYRKTYSQTIHPIPDKSLWTELSEGDPNSNKAIEIVINPPKSLRPPGRPRKKRVRAEDRGRVKRVVHCSRCNQTGHFRTTCAAPYLVL
ncbi:hypothetical protein OIU78_022640 [Salix suchowensis]|nr:hypothetical protein OIU78_022640 [Salix suchowensis]